MQQSTMRLCCGQQQGASDDQRVAQASSTKVFVLREQAAPLSILQVAGEAGAEDYSAVLLPEICRKGQSRMQTASEEDTQEIGSCLSTMDGNRSLLLPCSINEAHDAPKPFSISEQNNNEFYCPGAP